MCRQRPKQSEGIKKMYPLAPSCMRSQAREECDPTGQCAKLRARGLQQAIECKVGIPPSYIWAAKVLGLKQTEQSVTKRGGAPNTCYLHPLFVERRSTKKLCFALYTIQCVLKTVPKNEFKPCLSECRASPQRLLNPPVRFDLPLAASCSAATAPLLLPCSCHTCRGQYRPP